MAGWVQGSGADEREVGDAVQNPWVQPWRMRQRIEIAFSTTAHEVLVADAFTA